MESIFAYYDYREYMRTFYEERKRLSSFSWREFSRLSGFSSPNYLKVVCDGKSRLSSIGAVQVAVAMGLAGFESDYFAKMVAFNESKDESQKRELLADIRTIARENKVRVLDGDAYAYFDSWLHPVMRELLPIAPGAKPLELARMCYPEVSAEETRKSDGEGGDGVRRNHRARDTFHAQADGKIRIRGHRPRVACRKELFRCHALGLEGFVRPYRRRDGGLPEKDNCHRLRREECRPGIPNKFTAFSDDEIDGGES